MGRRQVPPFQVSRLFQFPDFLRVSKPGFLAPDPRVTTWICTTMIDIPQEIIDNVVAAVGDDTRLLKQCALVSSSFLRPSRKQLFSSITLDRDESCQGIHQFLIQNPVVQSFVRTIALTEYKYGCQWGRRNREWMNSTSLLGILRLPFCSLECFSIFILRDRRLFPVNADYWNWNSYSSEMRDALSNIILSPTLKTLSLTGIDKVPITFFLHIVHLTTLELHSLFPSDFSGEITSSLTQADSKEAAPVASHTVIDRCVWHLDEEHAQYEIPFICLISR